MLVFWCSHVSRLESLVFLWRSDVNVSKQVVMSFCKAGVSLCNRPTCLMMFAKFQNWRKSRRKCWFFCIHVSCRESLVFLWRRRVYGGSWKTCKTAMIKGLLRCSRFMQIRVFTVLRRLTFWLCSVARGHQAFTVNDMALIETVKTDVRRLLTETQANFAWTGVLPIQA